MRFWNVSFYLMSIVLTTISAEEECITVNKMNVVHKFVPFDERTDNFVKNIFEGWEKETFEVFNNVKDPEGIAVDLGAWIGTTSIWLAKNFYHVVSVDADRDSLKCLERNLKASECLNVSVCDRPVAKTGERVVFGSRGKELNESISYIKAQSDKNHDYVVQGITFKQFIHDYVYANEEINSRKIAFIKCDIEGGEEDILEDLLYFAYYNKSKVYVSFHTDWWKHKKITDFEHLFKFFKTNSPDPNVCTYITQNPFGSVLFEPLEDAGTLTKKEMPVIIVAYNLVSYVKNMVEQMEKYTTDIIVIDNQSDYEPLLDYYKKDFKYTLLRQKINHGAHVNETEFIQKLVGDIYLLTDPDLQFNPHLPENFIKTLMEISEYFQSSRVGFALSITSDEIREDVMFYGKTIKEWESVFWIRPLIYPIDYSMELYDAVIDTTFCLINRRFPRHGNHVRVAGDFTCFHLPWYVNFQNRLLPGEYDSYLNNNRSTSWFRLGQPDGQ